MKRLEQYKKKLKVNAQSPQRLFYIRAICHMAVTIGLTCALTFFFRELFLSIWPEGGTIAPNFLPLILYVVRYGVRYGLVCLSLYGILVVFLVPGSTLLTFWQVLGDMTVQYWPILVILVFKPFLLRRTSFFILGLFLVYGLMFGWAYTAGFLFYAQYAPAGQSKYFYSFIYNFPIFAGSFVVTSCVWWHIKSQMRGFLTGDL